VVCCGVLLILCNFTLHGYYLNDVLIASAIAGELIDWRFDWRFGFVLQ